MGALSAAATTARVMRDPAESLRFDPTAGTVVREPTGTGYGYWVGGKAAFDAQSGLFTLFYRERRPLEQGRAGRCAVAVSDDGISFDEVWSASKAELNANSVEEGHCVRRGNQWLLYLSYELAGTAQWRIDLMTADSPEKFDVQGRRTVLSPGEFGLSWIKDPFVMQTESEIWIYAAAPARTGPLVEDNFVSAAPLDATVLSRSPDGRYFSRIEYVFEAPGGDSWHGRRARINSVIPWDGALLGFYDGGRTFYDNYEEKAGLATSPDGRTWTRLDTGGPWVSSPHGIVRYVSAVVAERQLFFYYEYTREDGSHELRVSAVDPPNP